jgi:polyhydroxybutyrate depolymerase
MRPHALSAALIAAGLALGACRSSDEPTARTTATSGPSDAQPADTRAVELPSSSLPSAATAPADSTPSATVASDTVAATTTSTVRRSVDDRPFDVFVPTTYDGSTSVPLVVLLHGYTSTGMLQDGYFEMQSIAQDRGFLYVHPEGTTDDRGAQFWNGTDACCNLMGSTVDDSAYLTAVVEDIEATYSVDPKRIYFVGHSNGGFMSYRMACEHADKVAAIASLAGATFADVDRCRPSEPVGVLQIHGTADSVIGYEGGEIQGNTFPGAPTTAATWAAYNGCGPTPQQTDARRDLEANLPDTDTAVTAFADCPAGGNVELWTIEDGSHSPTLSSTFTEQVIDFLLAHPKP